MFASVQTTMAQNTCPGSNPPVARSYNFGGICVVYVDNLWPNSLAVLLTPGLDTMGFAIADNTGFASIIYQCNKTPYRVSSCTSTGCCNAIVPPQAILPTKLANFNAQVQGNVVSLKWNSVMELSSFKYVIQKSHDGRNFSDIGDVPSAGNSNKPIAYSFADKNFTGGVSYFRIKQVDMDGNFEFSKVVYVNKTLGSSVVTSVSPNPFVSDVQLIGISSSELNSKNIRLYNNFGQNIPYRITGANALEIDVTAARGLYFLQVKNQTFKLFKN